MGLFSDFNVGDGSSGEFEALPPGEYVGIVESIEEIENKPTAKDPNGSYLNVKFQIIDGDYKGRIIFDKWTYRNMNELAQNIGRGKITMLAKALGYAEGAQIDESKIMNKKVTAVVDVREASNGYAAQNTIKSFKAAAAGKPVQQSPITKSAKKAPAKEADAWDEDE